MKHFSQSAFPLAILALLAGGSFWLERVTRPEDAAPRAAGPHEIDYEIEKFSVRKLTSEGKLQYDLVAERMLHFTDDDNSEAIEPRLTYHGNPPLTRVSARRAVMSRERDKVLLKDDVRIRREAGADAPEFTLETSELTVFPDDERATTTKAVKLTRGSSTLDGVGMDFDNVARTLALHSQVRGTIHRK